MKPELITHYKGRDHNHLGEFLEKLLPVIGLDLSTLVLDDRRLIEEVLKGKIPSMTEENLTSHVSQIIGVSRRLIRTYTEMDYTTVLHPFELMSTGKMDVFVIADGSISVNDGWYRRVKAGPGVRLWAHFGLTRPDPSRPMLDQTTGSTILVTKGEKSGSIVSTIMGDEPSVEVINYPHEATAGVTN